MHRLECFRRSAQVVVFILKEQPRFTSQWLPFLDLRARRRAPAASPRCRWVWKKTLGQRTNLPALHQKQSPLASIVATSCGGCTWQLVKQAKSLTLCAYPDAQSPVLRSKDLMGQSESAGSPAPTPEKDVQPRPKPKPKAKVIKNTVSGVQLLDLLHCSHSVMVCSCTLS